MKPLGPVGKATKDEIRAHLEEATYKESPQRIQLFRDWELNRFYVRGSQWLEPVLGSGLVGSNGVYQSPFLQPIVDGDDLQPRPVHNEILPIFQNELARLVAAGNQIRVPPSETGPAVKKAAKLAEAVLKARDEEINFQRLKAEFVRNQIMFGLGVFLSEQTTDYSRTTRRAKSAMACPECRWIASLPDAEISDAKIPLIVGVSAIRAASMGARPLNFANDRGPGIVSAFGPDEQPKAEMTCCPECGGELIQRDAESGDEDDYLGNSLHDEIPEVDIGVSVINPRDFFPIANGRLDPDKIIRSWATEQIVSCDYVAQFYEDGYKVKPDSQETLKVRQWHPQGYEDGTYIVDSQTRELDGHTVLRRAVRLPYFEMDPDSGKRIYVDKGRWTVMAGNVVLIDSDLMIEDERSGKLIPRAAIHWAGWEPEDQSCFSPGLITHLRSPQDNTNTAFAQAIEARHDFSSPKLMLHPGQNIEYVGQTYGNYANSIWRYQGGTQPPIIQEGTQLSEQWRYEVQEYYATMQRIASSRDVEQGGAPKGVTAASALQLLAEKASIGRGPRIEATKNAVKSLGTHRLQLMGALFHEPRQFKAGGRGDRQAMKSFTGTDLMGQCDVEVIVEAFVESPVLRREAAKEALQQQTLVLRTAGDRRRFLDIMGVPADIAPDESIQVENATNEWVGFVIREDKDGVSTVRFGEAPIVKADVDDNIVHAEQHMIDIMSWEGEELRTNWSAMEVKIAGWRDEWDRLVAGEADLKANPPGELPPKQPRDPNFGVVNADMLETAVKIWQAKRDLAERLAVMPSLPELRIYEMWLKRCEGGDKPLKLEEADMALLRILAHREGHLHEARQAAMRAQAAAVPPQQAQPQAAAPQPA